MGCAQSTEQPVQRPDESSSEFSKAQEQRQEVKLLLLGAGESGKSTILRQLRAIHDKGYSVEERKRLIPAVHNHIITSIKAILQALVKLDIPLQDESLQSSADLILSLRPICVWTDEICTATKLLWQDNGIRECFERSNEYQLNDNADYFFDRLDEINQPSYVPCENDVIRIRIQTTGIFETKFVMGPMIFHMIDVGGQRSERRKWLLCFTDVTAVLFVVALSSYDQTLREDDTTNRLKEAFDLFESVWLNKYLKTVSMILLQNKIDLLAAKLKTSDMSKHFPEYTGGASYADATKYIHNRFLKIASHQIEHKRLYTHFLCAIDKEIVKSVFVDINNIILSFNLRRYGFI